MDYTARLNSILNKPGNKMCADCNGRNPRWASISLGVFVCIRCCGIHRALGTHISKMKSTTLDKWTPQMFHLFEVVDNDISNAYWESRIPKGYNKPVESSGSYAVESFLREKYERKQWIGSGPDPLTMATQPRQAERPQLKVEKKEEKRTLSAGPFEADLLSDSAGTHLRAHTVNHQPHLSTSDLNSHSKVQTNLIMPQFEQPAPAFNKNHLNLFPNGQALNQYNNTPPANLSLPSFPQASLVQGGNGVQTVTGTQVHQITYNNSVYPSQSLPQYSVSSSNPYTGQNVSAYPNSNFLPQGFSGPSISNFSGAVQPNFNSTVNPVNPICHNPNIEAEKNMKINQVLSMYSTHPAPGQNSGLTVSGGFKPLGAIAAQNFFNQGAQSHLYPTF